MLQSFHRPEQKERRRLCLVRLRRQGGGLARRRRKSFFRWKVARFDSKCGYSARPAAAPEAHAHWKLNPPRCPVTSTTSPMKYRPGIFLHSIVFAESSSVSTPPTVTSAFSKPSVPEGFSVHA